MLEFMQTMQAVLLINIAIKIMNQRQRSKKAAFNNINSNAR